ncbi:MAG: sulfite exporter TauE/SafE family protein [Candidatus Heimdallarchaeota archaeon]|nr:MAG: sulfite exporter TauE/SafE family protein [Candidatus Heimdallarchaeota archaeon]
MLFYQIIGDQYLSSIIDGIFFSIFAFIVGIISSSLGVGGGFITTPSLILLGINESYAIGTVLFMIIFTAISSTIAYARQPQKIEYRTGLLIAGPTVIGAVSGSLTSSYLATEAPVIFRIIFAICLFPIAIKMLFFPKEKKETIEADDEIEHDEIFILGFERREIYSAVLGLVVGFTSGLLGIGGGVVMVPILVHVGKLSMHKSVATSVFIMIATSIAGAVVKISMGQIYPDLALFLVLGIILGAQFGPRLNQRINTKRLQQIFGFVMIIALFSIAIGQDQILALIRGIIEIFF